MTPTKPGVVILTPGAQASDTTIVDMANPGREYDRVPDAPARAKRKYTRRHLDKQRHEAHEDKEPSEHGEADEQS